MKRLKCIISLDSTNDEQRILVAITDKERTITDLVELIVNQYKFGNNINNAHVYVDGFTVRLNEKISILSESEPITVVFKETVVEKKEKEKSESKEKKKPKEKKERKEKASVSIKTKGVHTPIFIDNTKQACEESEYAIPVNKIVRYDDQPIVESKPLRILKSSEIKRENTNTPTVNKQDDDKKKRTRRGKRAGVLTKEKNEICSDLQPIENEKPNPSASFLDFIVDDNPTVVSVIHQEPPFDKCENASLIVNPEKEDSILMTDQPHSKPIVPLLHDIVSCTAIHLDRLLMTPTLVEGDQARIYSEELDDIVCISIKETRDLKIISGPSLTKSY